MTAGERAHLLRHEGAKESSELNAQDAQKPITKIFSSKIK